MSDDKNYQKPSADTRSVHRLGRQRLEQLLRSHGFPVESARPQDGFDFLVRCDFSSDIGAEKFCKIKVVAASTMSFSVRRSHEKIANLVLAYVWHLDGDESPAVYALSYSESLSVAEQMEWTKTVSWTRDGYYFNNEPGQKLCTRLKPFLATPDRWLSLMKTLA